MSSVVIVHFDQQGELSYSVFGNDVRLYIVDERAPHDRVFEWTRRTDPAELLKLIPEETEIGHRHDDRHPAIAARVIAAEQGRPPLSIVEEDHNGQ